MGNSGGRPSASDPEFEAARRKFCESELESLKCLFDSLASQSSSDGQFIDPSVFQEHYGVHGALGERLFDLVTRLRRDQRLTFEDLVIAKGIYQMGSPSEIEDFIFQLVDVNGDGLVLRSELETVMNSVFEIISNSESAGTRDSVPQSNIEIFLNSIKPDMLNSNRDEIVTLEDFRKWNHIVPSLRKFLSTLLTGKAQGIPGRQLPNLLGAENIDSNLIIMKREYAWHISGALQQEDAQNWAILYHSSVHGLSFNTFMGNMANGQGMYRNGQGPTILLIKDTEGYIYGGYASQPWEKNSSFYGDMKSFLFTLFPAAAIYRATGANSNLQWCAINFTSESFPNGVGFGGRINHFGLFLSETFSSGSSFPSVTYQNPSLSKTSIIYPDTIECWGIISEGDNSSTPSESGNKGTILERFKEDRNMLNMMGIANSST